LSSHGLALPKVSRKSAQAVAVLRVGAMSNVTVSKLLQSFGLPANATSAQLHRAFLARAQNVHPDAGGRQDGRDFIRLKEDYDRARRELQKHHTSKLATQRDHTCSSWTHVRTSAWTHTKTSGIRWEDESQTYSPCVSPGLPPLPVWAFGTSVVVSLGATMFWPSNPSVHQQTISAMALDAPLKDPVINVQGKAKGTTTKASSYYASRVHKSEPSEIFKLRPHSKKRGCTYISPLHAAAEDGKAEWLHWTGERTGERVCQPLDRNRQTPLHYAARAGQYDACAVLLKFRADPWQADAQGRTSLDLAKENGNVDLVEMLQAGPPGPFASVQVRGRPTLHSQNSGIVG